MPKEGPPVDYGALLGGQSPVGSPPPVPVPRPMPGPGPMAPQPSMSGMPGPMPAPTSGPAPVGQPPTAMAAHAAAQAQLAAYNNHIDNFLKSLASDYALGRISRDDLKKGAAYTGLQPYHEWKNDNVAHLKEIAKASDQ